MNNTLAQLKQSTQQLAILLRVQEDLLQRKYDDEIQVRQAKERYQENTQKILRLTVANKRLLEIIEVCDKP